MPALRTLSISIFAFLAACGAPASDSPDSAVADAAIDAPGCGSCDDGDPATTDACVVDRCEHRRCADDAACDDGDVNTADRCVRDPETATWTCGHANADGDCESDADCFDDVDCTRDACGTGARCRHAWIPGCEGEAANALRPCPDTASEGGPCESDSVTRTNYDCRQGDDACADWLHCVGGSFDAHYVRVESVRPGCDAGGCPAEIPAGLCAPDLYCDYGEGLAPGRVYCDCWDRHDATIEWSCADEPCPVSPPADGSAVDRNAATSSATCYYGDDLCMIDLASWTWSCETTAPTFCPAVAPATGDTCELASECRYYGPESAADPVTTYRGDCTCDGSHWSCAANAAADCPAVEPRPGSAFDLCSPSVGNTQCWYPPPSGEDLWTHCHCDGPSDPNLWQCEETVHY
jgi:hypothetical protein